MRQSQELQSLCLGLRFCYFVFGECNFGCQFERNSPHFRPADLMFISSPYTALQPVLGQFAIKLKSF